MIESYEPFCLADPLFFEPPENLDDSESRYELARRRVPPGWALTQRQTWLVLRPEKEPMPAQGWKVHVSASVPDAEAVLAAVWDHCVGHRIAFKFLRSEAALRAANFKYASRGSSGKLAALYPAGVEALEATLERLGATLDGRTGPYILTDLRWRNGPLYLRYGSFVERYCPGPDGEMVLALEGPDGQLVEDERRPVFGVPPWVDVPALVADQIAARQREAASHTLPYDVEAALHFSNGGGVYLARDRDSGQQVVLKEARPFAGLDRAGTDAVARLDLELTILQSLEGASVPRVLGRFTCWEHHFMVQEYIDGDSLQQERARRHPLSFPDPTVADLAGYTEWALRVLQKVQDALDDLHHRGITYGDLHPSNVVLRPDGRITLLDFEQAASVESPRPTGLGVPGFSSPLVAPGIPADRFALGCLRLSMFLPLTGLLVANPNLLEVLLSFVEERFPVPAGFAEQVRCEIRPGLPPVHPTTQPRAAAWSDLAWEPLRDAIAGGILAAASPERTDRLYPGDPQQFRFGGHSLAYGAAGVLFALASTGVACPEEHVDWLMAATQRGDQPRSGLFDGLHGVAYALDRLGRTAEAANVLDRCGDAMPPAGHSLFGGLAGVGLTRLHFAAAHDDSSMLALAKKSAGDLVDRLGRTVDAPARAGGLTHGWAGAALFLARLHEHTGDPALLDGAVAALERDLARCETLTGGAVHLNDGTRVQPFLADGSAGVGLALAAVRLHRDSERYAAIAAGIERACRAELVWEPGLFHGRAGLLAYLASQGHARNQPALADGARKLAWHAQPWGGHILFPGRLLLRLSTDLATGSAGVLLALHGALTGDQQLPIPGYQPVPVASIR